MNEQDALDLSRVRLICRQRRRVVGPVLLADFTTAYLAYHHGYPHVAMLWYAACLAIHLVRTRQVRAIHEQVPLEPQRALARLNASIGALGLVKALILPTFFIPGTSEHTYLASVLSAGVAAGGLSSVGGSVRGFVYWGAPQFLVLALGWGLQRHELGLIMGVLWVLLFSVLLAHVRDQRTGIQELVRLAAEREEMARRLQAERDRANAAAAAKTQFFASASHDLRQPLHALTMNSTTLDLLAARIDDALLHRVTQGIGKALDQTRALLDSLLDVSRLDAGAVKARLVPCELDQLLADLAAPYALEAEQRGLRFVLDIGQRPDRPGWRLSTDPELLQRLLNNLLSNAMKFTARGEVRASLRAGSATLEITVADTGPGIAAEHRERIFEEFFQIGNETRDRSRGLGLGLSIVRRLALLLGAEVRVSAAPGEGSRFTVLLPQRDGPPVAAVVPATPMVEAPKPGRVLLVDDEPDMLEAMQTMLQQLGWQALPAACSADALRRHGSAAPPDVLIVDYRLPGETGIDAIGALRQRFGDVPALVLTGESDPQVLQRIGAAALPILFKPADGRMVSRALAQVMGAAQALGPGRRPIDPDAQGVEPAF